MESSSRAFLLSFSGSTQSQHLYLFDLVFSGLRCHLLVVVILLVHVQRAISLFPVAFLSQRMQISPECLHCLKHPTCPSLHLFQLQSVVHIPTTSTRKALTDSSQDISLFPWMLATDVHSLTQTHLLSCLVVVVTIQNNFVISLSIKCFSLLYS